MKKLSIVRALEHFCKQYKRWGVYLSFSEGIEDNPCDDIFKAMPYLNDDEDYQISADGMGFILCDSEEEAYKIFNQTVGDDGPTKTNLYDGPFRAYALVIGPDGFETENT